METPIEYNVKQGRKFKFSDGNICEVKEVRPNYYTAGQTEEETTLVRSQVNGSGGFRDNLKQFKEILTDEAAIEII